MQHKQVTLVCDIDQSEDDVTTVSLGLDGREYEMELCAADRAALARTADPWLMAARRAGRVTRGPAGRTQRDREHSAAVRAWASSRGLMPASGRGRIPRDVTAAYDAAHK